MPLSNLTYVIPLECKYKLYMYHKFFYYEFIYTNFWLPRNNFIEITKTCLGKPHVSLYVNKNNI